MTTGRRNPLTSAIAAPLVLAGLALAPLAGCAAQSSPTTTGSGDSGSASASESATGVPTSVPGATPVATSDLVALVSGRTFTGSYEGESYQEYYDPAGTIRGTEGGETYRGTWELRGDQLCFTYPDQASATPDPSCYTAAVEGTTVYWFGDTEPIATTYVAGNPGNL